MAGHTVKPGGRATANLTAPAIRLNVPTAAQSHLFVAESLMHGAQVLAAAEPTPHRALALVAGQALESMLKAFVCQTTGDRAAKALGHDLAAVWAAAAADLPIGPMPEWAVRLDDMHDRPFKGRYPEKTHAFGWPQTAAMVAGLAELLALVSPRVQP